MMGRIEMPPPGASLTPYHARARTHPSRKRLVRDLPQGIRQRLAFPPWRVFSFLALTAVLGWTPVVSGTATSPPTDEQMAQLWVEPDDIASRDLFHGAGGPDVVPSADVEYRFESQDATGYSRGYDVKGPDGRKWRVKVGLEAEAEIAVSRILWSIGYHQPVTHFLPEWRMAGGPIATPEPGRFRLESDHKKEGEWSWNKNPFVGTRPYRALVIANILLNNWDLTPGNNRIYRVKEPHGGPERWYVVQDVGGSLGKSGWPIGSRNTIKDFESQDFVKRVKNGRVIFDYHARHRSLLRDVTPADVVWTCRMLARLTERQLRDAFRAAGYSDEISARFVRKIRQKIQQGLALDAQAVRAR